MKPPINCPKYVNYNRIPEDCPCEDVKFCKLLKSSGYVQFTAEKLPSEEEILEKVKEALDRKDFKVAAKIICYYSFAKIDPKKFAKELVEEVSRFNTAKKIFEILERKNHIQPTKVCYGCFTATMTRDVWIAELIEALREIEKEELINRQTY